MPPLFETLAPCGPVIDATAAARIGRALTVAARDEGWGSTLSSAWPALEPVFAASPYLAGLARQDTARLRRALFDDPDKRLDDILEATTRAGDAPVEQGETLLRMQKTELHLLTALADLGGVWPLSSVTAALSRFADAALSSAMRLAAAEQRVAGRIMPRVDSGAGPLPGFFCVAMGKHGAFELNYSSDIDISIFYEPGAMPLVAGVEPSAFAVRFAERIAAILQRRTAAGYVFRVDLRLRPDPLSTPIAVPVNAAHVYYESVGQNWERAAFIKARVCAGDIARGEIFLTALAPFIWRRNLDFATIYDIQAIMRQIHSAEMDDKLQSKGADLKLGPGGIREIEFFVQTQQLILGGRHPALRSPRTLEALSALAGSGRITQKAARDLTLAYEALRALEHRVQMVADEQTHRLPASAADRTRIAALAGYGSLRSLDTAVVGTLKTVRRCCTRLFADEAPSSSRFGGLTFTGVEDDPGTLATLIRMGFENPGRISSTIRAWRHGHIAATRTERGRELFTRLTPPLLEAASATGAPDIAFNRFADFFGGLTMGVQVQSLFLAQPRLLELIVRVMAFGPRVARTLASRPAALDALLDPGFFSPIAAADAAEIQTDPEEDFEAAMNRARRLYRERAFRISVQVLAGVASAQEAGLAFADLADSLIMMLSRASLHEVERKTGPFDGDVAVIALGKCGSREMTARSDLDLMTLYRPRAEGTGSSPSVIGAETICARFTQRLVAALSAPTAEGELYEVDLQLRPSGTKGPVAVSFASFENYYGGEAEVWELLALTRARVVWSRSPDFAIEAEAAVDAALRRRRGRLATALDVREMRALMARERPPNGFWDMKLSDGGLVDIEFTAQYLQLVNAHQGGPLRQNTGEALAALAEGGFGPARSLNHLRKAWDLQQNLSQLLKVALEDMADPDDEPPALQAMLSKAGRAANFARLRTKLGAARGAAHKTFQHLV